MIDDQLHVIHSQWAEAADEAGLTIGDRQLMWGTMILNPFCLEGYS